MCSSGVTWPAEVEGEALVRHRVEEDAARLQFPEVGLDRPDRVLAVLEEVVGDDEVLRAPRRPSAAPRRRRRRRPESGSSPPAPGTRGAGRRPACGRRSAASPAPASPGAGAGARSPGLRRRGSGRPARGGRRSRSAAGCRPARSAAPPPGCGARSCAAGYLPTPASCDSAELSGLRRVNARPERRRRDPELELGRAAAALPRLAARPGGRGRAAGRRQRLQRRDRWPTCEREGVPHVSLPRNIGFAAAVNLGAGRVARRARSWSSTPTPCSSPAASARLLDGARGRPARSAACSRGSSSSRARPGAADVAGARLYSAGQALTADGRALELGAGEAAVRRAACGAREIFGVCGAACLLRRELFTELGGYDESYFAFYEDVDLNVRARIAGWRFAYVPEAVVWHVGNASWQAGFERPGARERAPGRAQPARHPGQVHAGARRCRGSPRSRSGRWPAPPASAACAATLRRQARRPALAAAPAARAPPPAPRGRPGPRPPLARRRAVARRLRARAGRRGTKSSNASSAAPPPAQASASRALISSSGAVRSRAGSPPPSRQPRRRPPSPFAVRSISSWPAQSAPSQASARRARRGLRHHPVAAQHVAAAPAGAGELARRCRRRGWPSRRAAPRASAASRQRPPRAAIRSARSRSS